MVDRLSNLVAIFDNPALDFREQPRRGRRPARRRLRIPDAPLRHRVGQEQGPVLHAGRSLAHHGQGHRRRRAPSQPARPSTTPPAAPARCCSRRTTRPRARTGLDLALYGQEMDNATAALARMNMILHDCPTAEIWQGNTLSSPHFKSADGRLKTFDFVVANPPFSTKAWSNGFNPAERRVSTASSSASRPRRTATTPSCCTSSRSLKSTGKGAVILPHGVLFRGGAEADIRKRDRHSAATSRASSACRPTCSTAPASPPASSCSTRRTPHARKGIFMIDASKGFIKDGNKNRLRAQDIHRSWTPSPASSKSPRYSRMVPLAEISDPKNDFNLNLPRYIDSTEPEDLQDIDAHLRGGIPDRDIDALDRYWQVFPAVRAAAVQVGRPPRLQPAQGRRRPRSRPPSSATPSSPPSTHPSPSCSRSGRRPTRRASKASPRATSPRR